MVEALIVEDDEAYALARELAERAGVPVHEAVVSSLRQSLDRTAPAPKPSSLRDPSPDDLTPEQRVRYEALRALAREAAAHVVPGATSDHSYLYGEFGLPK